MFQSSFFTLTDLNPWLTNNYPSDIEMPVYKPEVCYNIIYELKNIPTGFSIFQNGHIKLVFNHEVYQN